MPCHAMSHAMSWHAMSRSLIHFGLTLLTSFDILLPYSPCVRLVYPTLIGSLGRGDITLRQSILGVPAITLECPEASGE